MLDTIYHSRQMFKKRLPFFVERVVYSFLSTVDLFSCSATSKASYYSISLLAVRLFAELKFCAKYCFKCKKKIVGGVQFKNYFTKTSSFCLTHSVRPNRYRICLTQSNGQGRNASFTPLIAIYWPNSHGWSGNLST